MQRKRKRNSLILSIIALLMFVPSIALAADCTSPTIGGGGSSWAPAGEYGLGCGSDKCWATHNIGLRFQVYKVTAKNKMELIGNGVDGQMIHSLTDIFQTQIRRIYIIKQTVLVIYQMLISLIRIFLNISQ